MPRPAGQVFLAHARGQAGRARRAGWHGCDLTSLYFRSAQAASRVGRDNRGEPWPDQSPVGRARPHHARRRALREAAQCRVRCFALATALIPPGFDGCAACASRGWHAHGAPVRAACARPHREEPSSRAPVREVPVVRIWVRLPLGYCRTDTSQRCATEAPRAPRGDSAEGWCVAEKPGAGYHLTLQTSRSSNRWAVEGFRPRGRPGWCARTSPRQRHARGALTTSFPGLAVPGRLKASATGTTASGRTLEAVADDPRPHAIGFGGGGDAGVPCFTIHDELPRSPALHGVRVADVPWQSPPPPVLQEPPRSHAVRLCSGLRDRGGRGGASVSATAGPRGRWDNPVPVACRAGVSAATHPA